MADELKNVQRIDASDSAALESELQNRMIGTERATRRIGSKSSDGTYTEYMSKSETEDVINTTSSEAAEDKKPYINGFLDQDAPTITISVVSGNPQVVVSADTVDVVYYSNGTRFTIPLGESRTYLGSNVAEGMDWWVGFDDSGVLRIVETPSQIKVYCATALFGWNADDNEFIFSLAQPHGASMSTSTHENLHFTRGSVAAKGATNLKLDGFTFGDGSDNSHFQYNRLEGVYYDEDIKVEIPASIGWSPVFYELPNGNVRFQIQGTPTGGADSGILNAPSGRPYYNPDGLGLVEVPDEEYFLMFHYGIKGTTVNDVAIMGKMSYKTIGDARIACKLEGLRFNEEWAILREMVQLGVLIYKASDAFTNEYKAALVQYSTALDGNAIDYFDSRNVAYMELPPVRVEESSEFEYVGDYTFSQYSAYYAACAVNTSATPADFVTATTLTMSETATGGTNISATLADIGSGSSIKWTTTSGDSVIMAITGDPTIAAGVYTYPCEYVEHTGDFVNGEAVAFSRSVSVVSLGSNDVVDDSTLTTGSVTDALELLRDTQAWQTLYDGDFVIGGATNEMYFGESSSVVNTAPNPIGGIFRVTLTYGSESSSAVFAVSCSGALEGSSDGYESNVQFLTNQRISTTNGPCLNFVKMTTRKAASVIDYKSILSFGASSLAPDNVKIEALDVFNFTFTATPTIDSIVNYDVKEYLPNFDPKLSTNGGTVDGNLAVNGTITSDATELEIDGLGGVAVPNMGYLHSETVNLFTSTATWTVDSTRNYANYRKDNTYAVSISVTGSTSITYGTLIANHEMTLTSNLDLVGLVKSTTNTVTSATITVHTNGGVYYYGGDMVNVDRIRATGITFPYDRN